MTNALVSKIACKRANARKEGIEFSLTRSEVLRLLEDAGITCEEWRHDGYHLARIGDIGPYKIGNCRFINAAENYAEKKITQICKDAATKTIRNVLAIRSPEERSRIGRLGGMVSGGLNKLTPEELQKRFEQVQHIPQDCHFASRAAKILECTPQHVKRMQVRWKALGLK